MTEIAQHAGAAGGPVLPQYRAQTEGLSCPTGIDSRSPRLSWGAILAAPARLSLLSGDTVIGSQDIAAGSSAVELDPVLGKALLPLHDYRWTLGDDALVTGDFSTGLQLGGEWDLPWIGAAEHPSEVSSGVLLLRGTVDCEPAADTEWWIAATALGVYRLSVNGVPVSEEELAPGWTDYASRLRYRAVRVTALLHAGMNEIEAQLAPGWFAGNVAAFGPARYGTHTALSLGLFRTEEGKAPSLALDTDESWQVRASSTTAADLIMGETIEAETDSAPWQGATVLTPTVPLVESDPSPMVRVVAEQKCSWLSEPEPGIYIADFGANIVGRLRLRVPEAHGGARVRITHGEELDERGRLYTANLRSALQRDEIVLQGDAGSLLGPQFTVHGFRYAEITGWPGVLTEGDLVAEVLSTDLEHTAEVLASDPAVTALMGNIERSIAGNVLSVPTDCPQRDERLGWTADISVFGSTLGYLRDTDSFLSGWVRSIIDGQRADGAIPHVAPTLPEYGFDAPVWSDSIVHVPWLLWRRYGNRRILAEAYEPMRRWLDYCLAQAPDGIRPARSLGDWLAPGRTETPGEFLATASLAHTAGVLAQVATVLGEEEAAAGYEQTAESIRRAFRGAFLRGDAPIDRTQTAYAVALGWNLLESEAVPAFAAGLARLVEEEDHRLTTGFIGTPLLLPALSDHGHHRTAARIINQEGYPSWRYQVRAGATTMWERWDSWHHARGFQTAAMNSFNHYAYGCVGQWLMENVAGIGQSRAGTAGGFTDIELRPGPIPLLREMRARYRSAVGTVESGWRAGPDGVVFSLLVPSGATAGLRLPVDGAWDSLAVNGTFLMGLGETLPMTRNGDGSASLRIPAGRWTFTAPARAAASLLPDWDAL